MAYESKFKRDDIDELFRAILLLEDEEDCYRFFEDVCTVNEIHAIAQRLQVAKLLSEDKTYSEIEAVTKASTATISRINKCLVYGADGYKRILQRLADEDQNIRRLPGYVPGIKRAGTDGETALSCTCRGRDAGS